MTDTRKIVIAPDMHAPYEDRKAVGAMMNYMAAEKIDEFVQLGDFLDCNEVSAHNDGKPLLVEGERLADNYLYGNRLLDDLTEAARKHNKSAEITLLKGNHEYRLDRHVQKHPELEGMIEAHVGLRLKERGVKWVDCYPGGELHKMGHLYAIHGMYTPEHHAKKHVDRYGVNLVFGHVHNVQSFSKIMHGKNKTLMATSLGCLCRMDMPYLEGRPSNWQHAFGIAYIQPNGFFNLYPVLVFNGEFTAPNGKKYSYRDKITTRTRS